MNEAGIALMLAGVVVLVVGYFHARQSVSRCACCFRRMPDGYEALHEGEPVCRPCARFLNLRPWYAKERR